MVDEDLGGDPACWAHRFADDETGLGADGEVMHVVVDLAAIGSDSGGAIWSLPHGGDLDANLVRLDADEAIGSHVNNDVDVLMLVHVGSLELAIDGDVHRLAADRLALIRKGAQRSIVAGPAGVTYLSIHRQRSPLGIGPRGVAGDDAESSP